jgi:ABC-2 type transport system permease protein
MADLSAWSDVSAKQGGGFFGSRTRAQCAALMRMRWQTLSHTFRTTQGAFEIAARFFSYLIYAAMGIGLGIGAGAAAYQLAADNLWQYLPIEFWVVFFIWQAMPIALAAIQEQFDLGFVLRFPVSFSAFYALYLVFSLSDVSTIVGGLCSLGILIGVGLARPELVLWTAVAVAIFGVFNLVLVRVILAWVDRWLAQRRTREIVSALILAFFLSLQLLNPALHQGRGRGGQSYQQMGRRFRPYLVPVIAVERWLPPGLAARELDEASRGSIEGAMEALGLLSLYLVAAGVLLGARVRADYRGEELSEAPARKEETRRRSAWLLDGSGPIAAVIEKELRTVMRSMPLLYAMGAPLFMVLVFGSLLRSGGAHNASHGFVLALPLCVGYALLGSSQMVYNNLGTDGHAIQLIFLSPTPIRKVMLAKNLFHSVVFLVVALFAGGLATLRLGLPGPAMLVATVAWILFALPANLAAGNVFSIVMPHRMNLGRLKRQRASSASALLSLLVQAALLGFGGAVFGIAILLGNIWIAVPVFGVLAAASILAWLRVLHHVDGMANSRRDKMIAVLSKTD